MIFNSLHIIKRSKLDKANLDKLVHATLRRLILTLAKRFEMRAFLCLAELIEYVLVSNYSMSIHLDRMASSDVQAVFQIVVTYLSETTMFGAEKKYVVFRRRILLVAAEESNEKTERLRQCKLWMNVNEIILR